MKTRFLFILLNLFILMVGCSTTSKYARITSWWDEFRGNGRPNPSMWTRSVTEPGDYVRFYELKEK